MIRVIHADCDYGALEASTTALQFSGKFQVEICTSLDMATELSQADPPDIVLLDLATIPEQLAVSGVLSQHLFRQSVVVLTGRNVSRARVRHLCSMGAQAVLQKPLDAMTIASDLLYLTRTRYGWI